MTSDATFMLLIPWARNTTLTCIHTHTHACTCTDARINTIAAHTQIHTNTHSSHSSLQGEAAIFCNTPVLLIFLPSHLYRNILVLPGSAVNTTPYYKGLMACECTSHRLVKTLKITVPPNQYCWLGTLKGKLTPLWLLFKINCQSIQLLISMID